MIIFCVYRLLRTRDKIIELKHESKTHLNVKFKSRFDQSLIKKRIDFPSIILFFVKTKRTPRFPPMHSNCNQSNGMKEREKKTNRQQIFLLNIQKKKIKWHEKEKFQQ